MRKVVRQGVGEGLARELAEKVASLTVVWTLDCSSPSL